MSRFFSDKYSRLVPYTPGEQPKDMQYIKLNTNESPYPPSKEVYEVVKSESEKLHLYCDPESTLITEAIAKKYGVKKDEVIVTNGSDEALNFAFMAFCDSKKGIAFADITYGFYSVFAELNNIPYKIVPLKDDFTINIDDYIPLEENVVIANPNAPTGICLPVSELERLISSNQNRIVIVDEAYVDFGGESCVSLINKYENLLVTMTFSKSRSMAGARLGFAIGNKELIKDLNTIKYSTNPYNVNRMSQIVGLKAIENDKYYMDNCKRIIEARSYTVEKLTAKGFEILPSQANFIFARHEKISGEELYLKLKERGVLVRHFTKEKIKDFNRITIGTKEQMNVLINEIEQIMEVAK